MKIIKPYMVALLLLSSACNEIFGSNLSENENPNEQKNSHYKNLDCKIITDIAANVIIYRLLPLSVTKWSYHFLFMDFYAGYTMLGVTFMSPKFLTFCNGKLRIGFGDLNLNFWRVIPLVITHRFCKNLGENDAMYFYFFNVIDAYFLYIQWKMVKISWLNFTNAGNEKESIVCPFFFADGYEDNFYNNNTWPTWLLFFFPKISLNFSWNKDHENEDVEDELD